MRSSEHLAFLIQLSTLVYLTVDNHVSLRPWNNLKTPQWKSTLLQWLLWSGGLASFWNGWTRGMIAGTLWIWIFLLLQFVQWWVPYLAGRTFLHDDFSWYWEGGYEDTLHLIPIRQNRPSPDAQHMTLQLMTILSGIFAMIALLQQNR
jgi:hypothetical protein